MWLERLTMKEKWDKNDIIIAALRYTDRWKFERILTYGEKANKYQAKIEELKVKSRELLKEIESEPEYKENLRKIKKQVR
jgi:hypothetical protein